jgi:ComF family protein
LWINSNYENTAQQLVQLYKFGQLRAASQPLANLMARNFLDFHQKTGINLANYIVVPVPTATSRQRQRGFDHLALLAKTIAHQLGLHYSPTLGRLGQSRQLGTSRAQRLTQPAGSYFVKRPAQIAGRDILLIDDVITTGGTIIECSKILRAAGSRHVDALVFAKKL